MQYDEIEMEGRRQTLSDRFARTLRCEKLLPHRLVRLHTSANLPQLCSHNSHSAHSHVGQHLMLIGLVTENVYSSNLQATL